MAVLHRGNGEHAQAVAQPVAQPVAASATPKTSRSAPTPSHDPRVVRRTPAGAAWVATCVSASVLIALVAFIAQNTHRIEVSFLGWHGGVPLAVALLIAALAGMVLVLVLGTTRITQLRRAVRRNRG